jgi:adenylyltransferase/sulfurtransferase
MQLTSQENEYYNRQIILENFGTDAQSKLKQARVLVIGAGGLGCPVLQYLTAAGVGNIGIIDGDVVSVSNLHRQILFSVNDIGKQKATVAKEKLTAQNPNISIESFTENITVNNAVELIQRYDIVADCTDNFAARYLINDACVLANKPFVSAAILKFEGQLSVFNHLTKINYRDVFPEPPTEVQNCAEAGVIGVLCGIIGSMQANEIIKIITGVGETLEGKLFCYDALTNKTQSFRIKSSNIEIKELQDSYAFVCETNSNPLKEITVHELKQKMDNKEDFQLIDVREQQEFNLVNIGGELIPLNSILENTDKISKTKQVIIYCKSGVRSAKAIDLLQQNGFTNLFNLKGGIIAYAKEIDPHLPMY